MKDTLVCKRTKEYQALLAQYQEANDPIEKVVSFFGVSLFVIVVWEGWIYADVRIKAFPQQYLDTYKGILKGSNGENQIRTMLKKKQHQIDKFITQEKRFCARFGIDDQANFFETVITDAKRSSKK